MSNNESATLNHRDDTEMTNNSNNNTNINLTPAPPQSQESHNNNNMNDDDDDDDHVVLEEEDMFTTVTATTAPGVPPRDNNNNFVTSSSTSNTSTSTTTTTTTTRYDTFTEAVPLSLSSMAHLNIPLTDGVVDGIIQVIHHTLIQCVHYITRLYGTTNANAAQHGSSPPSPVSFFSEIATTPYAWKPIKEESSPTLLAELPHALKRLNFVHLYSRNALIYHKPQLPDPTTYTAHMEEDMWKQLNPTAAANSGSSSSSNDPCWCVADDSNGNTGNSNNNRNHSIGLLGRIRLFYCSPEPLTPGELNGTETDDDDDDDTPPCILYKMMVEYCCAAPTGNIHAVQAEELSMLSFGSGSIDDDIKYGALASLYDELAKYVLEIYSVRGKRYKFDLMDSTLANGTVPHIPAYRHATNNKTDPFLKNLCVTVTDHPLPTSPPAPEPMTTNTNKNSLTKKDTAVTRIFLSLEGKLRTGGNKNSSNSGSNYANHTLKSSNAAITTTTADPLLPDVPAFDYLKNVISYAFLRLNPKPSEMVQAHPSGHILLLDPDVAGHLYINGRYAMTWGDDNGISASHGTALFGIDLHSIPFWNGRIVDYELVKEAYAQLWHEILIDAKLQHLNIASKLLHRLIKGIDPVTTSILEEDNELYDDTNDDDNAASPDIHQDCLESLVLAAPNYDRVGIAAKALATRFAFEFGKTAFPCLSHETEWVQHSLPDREPIIVPQRLINILRRGGYFDVQKTVDLLWFTESRPIQDEYEMEIVNIAVQYLEEAGCTDVDSENVVLISSPVAENVIAKDVVCRWDPTSEQFYVHEDFFKSSINDLIGSNIITAADETANTTPQRIKGYLLGMYIAKAHPVGYGKVLARYLLRNKL